MGTDSQYLDRLDETRLLCGEICQSLPKSVPAAGLTCRSKLPFKATSVRELLIHRTADLASAALDHLEAKRTVPGAILVRSVIETVAVMYCLDKSIQDFLLSPDIDKADAFFTAVLVGTRWQDHPVQAVNVLTLINKVTKEIPAFRDNYDSLSEYVHPNWSGLLGSYGTIDKQEIELILSPRESSSGVRAAVLSLGASLYTFKHYYNQTGDSLTKFNSYFESQK